MAELAKTHITITDESAYASGVDTLVPLYVFATEQDKVVDESTGEIATGTIKSLANQVTIVTSKKDVIEKFGIPTYVEVNGTIQQNDERNEHGLFALYDAMGSTSVAYALRADIDLKQLEPTSVEPTSNVKNGTVWLDMYNTTLGLFVNNGNNSRPSKAWDMITNIELMDKQPDETIGEEGDYAVVFEKGVQTVYERKAESWVVLGDGQTIFHNTAIDYPKGTEKPLAQGDIWVKTTSVNNGANYVLKRWSESAERWSEISAPMVATDADASKLYGENLVDGVFAIVYDATSTKATIKMYMNDAWRVAEDVKISMFEPRDVADEGTMWFNNELKFDIMVNDGDQWKGFNNQYPEAKIYVTSSEPTPVMNDSLWIDPSAEIYPTIRRYYAGEWELINNTDQSTPDGILFADARYYAGNEEPTYSVDSQGAIISNLLTSDVVDPDAPKAPTYPAGILLFNTRFSTNNVKEYKANPFVDYADEVPGPTKARWVSVSGNAVDGSGLFGAKAQRTMVVKALASAIASNEDIRSQDYDFFFATCPGYPEVDDELINLNVDKKEMFEIISDTPKTLRPQGKEIQEWGTNANNASSHGLEGRVLKNEYVTRQYPPMGLTTNVDGSEIAVPSSVAKMKNLLVLPRGQICAGTQNGQVVNLASVGYITDEDEYASVVINDGLGEICTAQSINPIMPRRNTGLLFWGESTENPITSSLSDEHAIITLLRLKRQLEAACLPFFFRINNESLRSEFYRALQSVLNIFIGTGEIYDYALEVESENTAERINRKELWAAVAIEIAKGVEQIYIPIKVVSTGALSA